MLELEILDPDDACLAVNLVGALADQLEAQVLDRRQHVRNRNRAQAAEQLELQLVRRLLLAAIERHVQPGRLGHQALESADVVDRDLERRVLLVRGGEGPAPGAEEPERLGLAAVVEQRILQLVLPGADRLRDPALELDRIDAGIRLGRRADQHVQPRQDGLGQRHLRLDREPAEGFQRELLDSLPRLGVVAVTGHVDEAGVEAAEHVAAHEEADLRALVEVHDAAHDADEVRDRRLEQFVTRESFQRVNERLVVVARGLQPETARRRAVSCGAARGFRPGSCCTRSTSIAR